MNAGSANARSLSRAASATTWVHPAAARSAARIASRASKQPDKIDRKHGGFLNLVERIAGKGRLFHCRWCRLQFFDRRAVWRPRCTASRPTPAAA